MLVDQMPKSLGVILGNFRATAIEIYFYITGFYTSSLSTPTKTGPGSTVQASRDPLQEQGEARSVYR